MPEIIIKNEYITLPIRLVEEIFPTANATFIKVYMHMLMLAAKGRKIDMIEVAGDLQLLESDVLQAVHFWSGYGVLDFADERESEFSAEQPDEPSSYNIHNVTENILENSKMSEMLQLAQEVLGKTISTAEMKTLYWMYDSLGFSPEVILMLLEYCVSINKRTMQYIERVATSWHSKGISTIEDVEEFLSNEEYTKNYMNSLKALFGIRDRSLTSIEEDFIKKWHDTFGMSEEMIALAYEYCILRINKLSFPYMDGIIVDWNDKNIRTIEEAEIENENFKKNKAASNNAAPSSTSFENEELEKFTWEQMD